MSPGTPADQRSNVLPSHEKIALASMEDAPLRILAQRLRLWAKWLVFPGLDLHTRCRYRFLPRFFRKGPIATLDAGCGNGALAFAAYRLGNRVLGVTLDAEQIAKASEFFAFRGIEAGRLEFQLCNLYDLPGLGRQFDQIICSETLEHIKDDARVVGHFHALLREGGVLHVCSPFSNHPEHHGRFDVNEEAGWHVRDGYTIETYRKLLEPAGFEIVASAGLGSSLLVRLDRIVRRLYYGIGPLAALPFFVLLWPLLALDSLNPTVPYSLYVQAVKRGPAR